MIPNDPFILLSYVNTQLRDFYPGLEDMCDSLGLDKEKIVKKLGKIDYEYDGKVNQFV